MQTLSGKLATLAVAMLRANDGSINKAAPRLARELMGNANRPLLITLVADYLAKLPAAEVVSITPAAPEPKPQPARRPLKMPTPEQQAGTLRAKKVVYDAIFGRKARDSELP
jgi:hypothetical protein